MVVGTGASLTASGTGSIGATTILGGLANDLPYQAGAGTTGFIAPVDNAVLTTGAGGVPAESTTLPSGLTIPGYANCTAGTSGSDCLQLSSGLVPVGNLPVATTSALGVVQPDGTIITDTSGAITVAKASSSAFGVVECGSGTTCTSGVISVSGGGGNYVNIGSAVTWTGCTYASGACTISGSSTTAVTISSIPGTYLNLHLVVVGENTGASLAYLNTTFNADSGANYQWGSFYVQAGSATWGSGSGDGTDFGNTCQLNQSDASICEISIPYYVGGFDKFAQTIETYGQGSATYQYNFKFQTRWNSTAAITSITFTLSANDYGPGTAFMAYATN
jgi:hypothetical protein